MVVKRTVPQPCTQHSTAQHAAQYIWRGERVCQVHKPKHSAGRSAQDLFSPPPQVHTRGYLPSPPLSAGCPAELQQQLLAASCLPRLTLLRPSGEVMTSAFSTSPHSATSSPSSVSVYFQGMPWMHTCSMHTEACRQTERQTETGSQGTSFVPGRAWGVPTKPLLSKVSIWTAGEAQGTATGWAERTAINCCCLPPLLLLDCLPCAPSAGRSAGSCCPSSPHPPGSLKARPQ